MTYKIKIFWALALAGIFITLFEPQIILADTPTRKTMKPIGGKSELLLDGLQIDFSNWVQATDPNLAKINNQWWMFFTSINIRDGGRLHTLAVTLPPNKPLDSPASEWKLVRDDKAVKPIISPSPDASAWDGFAIEAPSYIRGYDATQKKWVERIYYTGWPRQGASNWGYTIGFVEKKGDIWVKYGSPVVYASEQWEVMDGKGIIGDQAVYYQPGAGEDGADGIWHMWYQANGEEGVSLAHISSKDGINWENKKQLTPFPPYPNMVNITAPYHLDVMARNGRYYFIGWVSSVEDINNQGIWLVSSSTPDGSAKGDFTDWMPVVYEKSAKWHYAGELGSQCHSTGLFSATFASDENQLWAFYSGIRSNIENSNPCKEANGNIGSIGKTRINID